MNFWEDIEPLTSDGLEAAVARAYDVFGAYKLSGTITYCDCPVCMTDGVARALSTTPLKEIPSKVLAEYTNSAHGHDKRTEREFKYFLPRYLELIAQCDPPTDIGLEVCLTRLDGYRASWPAAEIEAVDGFFDAFVGTSIHQLLLVEWPVGLRLEFDMGEVLGMVALSGGDLDRVLAVVDKSPDPEAAVHLASLRDDVEVRNGVPHYTNAHLDTYPEAKRRIGEWLMRDVVDDRIIAAHDALADPAYDAVLNLAFK